MWTLFPIHGVSSSYIWPLAYGLLLLVLLLSGFALLLLAMRARRIALTTRNAAGEPIVTPPLLVIAQTSARKTITNVSKALLILLIGLIAGAKWDAHRALANRHHYVDVLIAARYDAKNFLLQPVGMLPWPATSCTPLDWQEGWRMQWVDYQQELDCKDFLNHGSFVCYYGPDGQCQIFKEELAHVIHTIH